MINNEALIKILRGLAGVLERFRVPFQKEIADSVHKAEMARDSVKECTDELDATMAINREIYLKVKDAVETHDMLTEKWMFPYSAPHSILGVPVRSTDTKLLSVSVDCYPDAVKRTVEASIKGPSQKDEEVTETSNPFMVALDVSYFKNLGEASSEKFSFPVPMG